MRLTPKSLRPEGGMSKRVSARLKAQVASAPPAGTNELGDAAGQLVLVLLEPAPPAHSGIETLTRFRQIYPQTPVLVVSAIEDREHILAAFAAGATGYIRRSSGPAVVATAMRAISEGGRTRQPRKPPRTRQSFAGRRSHQESAPQAVERGLSERQKEVLRLVASGLANKDIARELNVSENTVKVHLRTAYARLNVCSRTQAMAKARRLGIDV